MKCAVCGIAIAYGTSDRDKCGVKCNQSPFNPAWDYSRSPGGRAMAMKTTNVGCCNCKDNYHNSLGQFKYNEVACNQCKTRAGRLTPQEQREQEERAREERRREEWLEREQRAQRAREAEREQQRERQAREAREVEQREREELEQALEMSRVEAPELVRVCEYASHSENTWPESQAGREASGQQTFLRSILSGGPPCEVSADLARRWTQGFSDDRKIGEGAFGDVFEGKLGSAIDQRQVKVAVKRLKPAIRLQGDETEHRAALSSIRREIHVLSTFFHPNIIRLLGYTSTSAGMIQEMCLIYELGQCGS